MIATNSGHRPDVREALRLLGVYTAGRFDLYALAGQGKASVRAHLMAVLTGRPRVNQAAAGIAALRSAFYAACFIVGNCEAEREDRFLTVAREYASRAEEYRV